MLDSFARRFLRTRSTQLNFRASIAARDNGILPQALTFTRLLHTPLATHLPLTSLLADSRFRHRHVLSVSQFDRQDLRLLFTVAQEMQRNVAKNGLVPVLCDRVISNVFYEPSTRTYASFDVAMQRLGGRTVAIYCDQSAQRKGESLRDTICTLGCYSDAIVLRHPDPSSASIAATISTVPIINGGNGSREHPTQAFLDLFTIEEELGSVDGLTITFVGDLKYGRTVHSLIELLQWFDVRINLVSSTALAIPDYLLQSITTPLAISDALTPELVSQSDVLYCTRIQRERFHSDADYEHSKNGSVVNNHILKHAKRRMVIMHPLPRNEEIPEEVDTDQRAAYFRQVKYGLFTRMALLALVLAS